MALFDDFTAETLDPARWAAGEIRDGDKLIWRWIDPGLVVSTGGRRLELAIERFSLSHDSVQIFDNPKALYMATQVWNCDRPLSFSTTLAAQFSGDTADYRNGFASFNVLDFATSTVLDIVGNGRRLWAITERLDMPGFSHPVAPFTEVTDLGVDSAPLQEHAIGVHYDPQAGRVSYRVDGSERYGRAVDTAPQSLMLGLGLITLYPIVDGRSTSCRGQGGIGRFGPVSVD